MKLNLFTVVGVLTMLLIAGCDSDSNGSDKPTGTVTATIGGQPFSAVTITRTGSTNVTYRMTSSDDRKLDFTVIGISSPGQYSFFNQALSSGPGIAGGFYPGGESYAVDSGTILIQTISNSRFSGTFSGTARGLLGAADLSIANGSFDIQF